MNSFIKRRPPAPQARTKTLLYIDCASTKMNTLAVTTPTDSPTDYFSIFLEVEVVLQSICDS